MGGELSFERTEGGFSLSYRGLELISGGFPFAFAGVGRERISMRRGNFDIQDYVEERLPLRLESWERFGGSGSAGGGSGAGPAAGGPAGSGPVGGPETLLLRLAAGDARVELRIREIELPAGPGEDRRWLEIGIEAPGGAGAPAAAPNRFWFRFAAAANEHFYGCGEQFSHLALNGRRFPLWTSEQGVGRNKSTPITFQADLDGGSGGDYWWTFYPEPSFVSDRGYYLHAESSAYAAFDFARSGFVELEFWEAPKRILVAARSSTLDAVRSASALLGRQASLPEWTQDGVILGIQGGTEICLAKLERALGRGVPVTGIWAQDWEGINVTSFGQRLRWNWQWDRERYPGLDRAIVSLRERGIRFLGYANPNLAAGKPLFQEAEALGHLARNAAGGTYLVDFGEFDAGIVDLTSPAAFAWFKGVIRRELIDLGLAGWMADFGEYLPTDAVLADGKSAMIAHNAWPALWARLNREAVDEAGAAAEVVYFMRAGFAGSQAWCPLMWAGDQNVDWSEDDGLPSALTSALSLAACGHGLHHSDIGGYTTLYGMRRTKELFMRWAELAAFTPMMRTHEGNRPAQNWQFDSDDETLDHLARMGRLFRALKGYRAEAMALNARLGVPVMRPLFLRPGAGAECAAVKDQFLLGDDLLVAPVLREGAVSRELVLPPGRWIDCWTGREAGGREAAAGRARAGDSGACRPVSAAAPLGKPPAFVDGDSPHAASILAAFDSLRG